VASDKKTDTEIRVKEVRMKGKRVRSPGPAPPLALAVLTAAFVALLAIASLPAPAADGPRLILDPDTVETGDSVTVHCIDFCGEEECSTISIQLDDRVVVDGVEVRRDGYAPVKVGALAPPGRHTVTAVQAEGHDGERVEAFATLTIAIGDRQPPPEETPPIPR
jgi:hypothetical protein